MQNTIKLVDIKHNTDTFNMNYTYEYKFILNSEIKNNELAHGFKDELIQLLTEDFFENITNYLDDTSTPNT